MPLVMLGLIVITLAQAPSACTWAERFAREDLRVGVIALDSGERCGAVARAYPEIHFVLEGSASYDVGGDSFLADAGTAVLVPEGTPFRARASGGEPLRLLAYRWAPGGDEDALHAASTMTDDVDVPDVPTRRGVRPRRYESAAAPREPRFHVNERDVDWTTNFTYDEALWEVYRYKPLVRTPLADWPGIARSDVRMGLQELEPGAAYPGHHHPSPEVYFVLSGEARWEVGDETLAATAGTLVLTPPDTRHRIENTSAERLRWLYLWWAPGGSMEALR